MVNLHYLVVELDLSSNVFIFFTLASLHAFFFWWSRIIIASGAYSFRFSDHGGCSKAVYCCHQTLGFFLPWIWFPRCKVSEMQELLLWIHKYDSLIMWKITGLEECLCRILQDCGELWRTLAELGRIVDNSCCSEVEEMSCPQVASQ
jgi:hypothetical protein